jgi:hypothetical protein
MSVKESAERLRRLMIEKCPALEARFNPGLSPEECKALAAQYDVVLTQELIDFFGVINGFDDIYISSQEQKLYWGYRFNPLAHTLEHYKTFFYEWSNQSEWLDVFTNFFESKEHTIPPLRFMEDGISYFYAADLEGENKPVWSFFRELEFTKREDSLQAFLDMLNTKIESGNLFYDKESESWEQIDG